MQGLALRVRVQPAVGKFINIKQSSSLKIKSPAEAPPADLPPGLVDQFDAVEAAENDKSSAFIVIHAVLRSLKCCKHYDLELALLLAPHVLERAWC